MRSSKIITKEKLDLYFKTYGLNQYPIIKNDENKTVFTNGKFMFIFDEDLGYPLYSEKTNGINNVSKEISNTIKEPDRVFKNIKVDNLELKYKVCDDCKGQGFVKNCPECEGDGEVTLTYDGRYSEYHYEATEPCEYCDGNGFLPGREIGKECECCGGQGKLESEDVKEILGFDYLDNHAQFFNINFNYLKIVKIITNLTDGYTLLNIDKIGFRFDGGCGVIMISK